MSRDTTSNLYGRDDNQDRSQPSGSSAAANLSAVDGDATSLFPYVVRHKVWGTNIDPPESAKDVIKPWDQRLSTAEAVQSNVDDQLTITVPFTCPVRIKSILINTGTGDFAPTRCRAFVNRPDGIDFDEADAATSDTHPQGQPSTRIASTLGAVGSGRAQADFALLQGEQGVVEYPVSVARFSSTNSVTLVLSHSNSTTLSRFYYLGFRGTALQLSKDPSERLDIAAANAADKPIDGVREKRTASHGLAGGSGQRSSPRFVVSDKDASEKIAGIAQRSPHRSKAGGSRSANTTPRKSRPSKGSAPSTPESHRNRATGASTAPITPLLDAQPPRSTGPVHRKRSLSQPPPADTILRHLQQPPPSQTHQSAASGSGMSSMRTPVGPTSGRTPSRSATKQAAAMTPGRRALGTPHRPGEHSFGTLAQTPATEKRKKRNDALMASAQRTREKRRRSIRGVGGWGGGREESPIDILRRLARAPGFVVPPTPQHASEAVGSAADAAKMPPPAGGSAGISRRTSSFATASATASSVMGRDSLGAVSRSSTSGRQSSMLRPGESVPGDLTRESQGAEDSAELDDSNDSSFLSSEPPERRADGSLASEAGAARRKSLIRGGIFASLAERGRNASARASDAASRLSLGTQGDVSALSAATSGLGAHRESELERSLALSLGGGGEDSLTSLQDDRDASLDGADARAMERLDELTRRSLFSNEGLSYGDDGGQPEEESFASSSRRKLHGRSLSEPPNMESDEATGDFSSLLADSDAGLEVTDEQVDPVRPSLRAPHQNRASAAQRSRGAPGSGSEDKSRVTIGSTTDAATLLSEASRGGNALDGDDSLVGLQDRSILSESRSRTNLLLDEADVSSRSAPQTALSDEDDAAFESASSASDVDEAEDIEGLENSDGKGTGVRRLDLLDPKDLNALLKRRIVRKRKGRVSPFTGAPVPQLPASTIKDVFSSFLHPNSGSQTSASLLNSSSSAPGRRARAKLDKPTLEEVEEAGHDFFASFAQQLLLQARSRTKRRAASASSSSAVTITEVDVLSLLKQQGHVTARSDITSVAHRLLPREVLDQMNLPKLAGVRAEVATPSIRSVLPSVAASSTAGAPAQGRQQVLKARPNDKRAAPADTDEDASRQGRRERDEPDEEEDDDDDDDDEDSSIDGQEARIAHRTNKLAKQAPGKRAKTSQAAVASDLPSTPIRRPARPIR